MNNVKNSIGWAEYTWNPITGCKRGCQYCYARRINERFNKTPFDKIIFHPERLEEPMPKKFSIIFVGSMSDIEYWNHADTQKIIDKIEYKNHQFMFLSKSPFSYHGFMWPNNTMQGLTMTLEEHQDDQTRKAITMIRNSIRPYLSIEPILGELKIFKPMHLFHTIIVGAMTGPGAIKPKREWIQSIKDNIPPNEIYWKKNIRKCL